MFQAPSAFFFGTTTSDSFPRKRHCILEEAEKLLVEAVHTPSSSSIPCIIFSPILIMGGKQSCFTFQTDVAIESSIILQL